MSSLGRVSYPSIEIDGDHGSARIRAMRTKNTLVALTLLLAASRVSLAAENPLMGTWKLNESKSKYAPGSAKNTRVAYTAAKGAMISARPMELIRMGSQSIGPGRESLMANLTRSKEVRPSTRWLITPVNERTNDTTATKDGKVVMTATITVAKGGKSRVVTLIGTDASGKKFTDTTYYDKE